MTRHMRVTFSTGGEILEYSLRHLRHVVAALEAAEDDLEDERARMIWESIRPEQVKLLEGIEQFVEDADSKILNQYMQYIVELPEELVGPAAPVSSLELVRWLAEANEPLVQMFREQAESAEPPEAQEAFDGLRQQIESHNRKISKEYQRFQDM